jgi:hypothetical protein
VRYPTKESNSLQKKEPRLAIYKYREESRKLTELKSSYHLVKEVKFFAVI